MKTAQMIDLIRAYGDFAYGIGSPSDVAQEWAAAGFSVHEARQYLDARCFDASRAAQLRDAGVAAKDAPRRTTAELGDREDTVGYLHSNGDITLEEAAALGAGTAGPGR